MELDLSETIKSLKRKKMQNEISDNSYRIKLTNCIINLIRKNLNYDYVCMLGQGSWSNVFLMQKAGTDEQVAMKVVTPDCIHLKESELWPSLKHRNILRLQETIFAPAADVYVYVTPSQKTALDIYLMSEFFTIDPKGLEKIQNWFYDVLSGLEYLHQRKLCHCDLKANNVLIASNLDAVIADFTYLTSTTQNVTRYGLPLLYRPPEVVVVAPGQEVGAEGIPFDLWSVGMLALNVVTGHYLKGKLTGVQPMWSENIYPEIYDLIKVKNLTEHVRQVLPSVKVSKKSVKQIRNFITLFLRLQLYSRVSTSLAKAHQFLGRGQFEKEPEAIWIRKETKDYVDRLVSWYRKPDYSFERLETASGYEPVAADDGEDHKVTFLFESESEEELPGSEGSSFGAESTPPADRQESDGTISSDTLSLITARAHELLTKVQKELIDAGSVQKKEDGFARKSGKIARSLKLLEGRLNLKSLTKLESSNFNLYSAVSPENASKVALYIVTGEETSADALQLWPGLCHPNIDQLSRVVDIPSLNITAYLAPLHNVSLYMMLRNENILRDFEGLSRAKNWLLDVLYGLQYLHARRLCHLDINSNNVLITEDRRAVIGSFSYLSSTSQRTHRYGVPLYFRPPEACLNRGTNIPLDGLATDLWSVGILAMNMVTGHSLRSKLIRQQSTWSLYVYPVLYKALQLKKLGKYVSLAFPSSKITEKCLVSIRSFVTMFLRLDPKKRPPTSIAIRHEWLGVDRFSFFPEKVWQEKTSSEEIEALVSHYNEPATPGRDPQDVDLPFNENEQKDDSTAKLNEAGIQSRGSGDICNSCKMDLLERWSSTFKRDCVEDLDSGTHVERITIIDGEEEGTESISQEDTSSRITNGESLVGSITENEKSSDETPSTPVCSYE